MSLKAQMYKLTFDFRFDARTSRGVYTEKEAFFVKVFDTDNPIIIGIGEAAPLKGLSIDDLRNFEEILQGHCNTFNTLDLEVFPFNLHIILSQLISDAFPSIKFAFETALLDYMNGGKRLIFDNDFVKGNREMAINGLIWMGDKRWMMEQVEEKIRAGYDTIKLKIGGIDFEEEKAILKSIRNRFSVDEITLRLDANGAFSTEEVKEKLMQLADYQIHSIEQPIKPHQRDFLAELCETTPIPIALDEELIGTADYVQKLQLLKKIKPQYIILKPTLLGGLQHCREWIEVASHLQIGWWLTSALESNIGLNAIAQFTAEYKNLLPQGLGTGQLYHNNFSSPLLINNGKMRYDTSESWELNSLLQ